MQPFSPHYRNDDWHALDEQTKNYLDTHYLQKLPNIDRANPKVVVVFSGGNAIGKTTLARKIERELGGLILENDEIKRELLIYNPEINQDDLNKITWQYSMNLYRRLDSVTSNGLIVRDGVIDWYFDRILPLFDKAGYALFVISFDISRAKAEELILARGNTQTVKAERLLAQLDDHEIHTKRFRSLYKSDIILKDNNLFEHTDVISKLRFRLSQL